MDGGPETDPTSTSDLSAFPGETSGGTLVERTSRYVVLFPVPAGHKAPAKRAAFAAVVARVPAHLRRSLTWDQVKEMAEHVRFTVAPGLLGWQTPAACFLALAEAG